MKIALWHGQERFGWKKGISSLLANRRSNQLLFIFSCLCPLALFSGVYQNTNPGKAWEQFLGGLSGALAALLVLYLTDIFQLLLRNFQVREDATVARNVLFPFPTKLAQIAAKKSILPEKLEIKILTKLEKLLEKLPDYVTSGYVRKRNGSTRIYSGHLFAIALLVFFGLTYSIGFGWWYSCVANACPDFSNIDITAMSYVLILAIFLCLLLSGVSFFFDRFNVPTFIVIAVILSLSSLNHTYSTKNIEGTLVSVSPAEIMNKKKGAPYIILVAASGGGIQASAWTNKVLSELIKECKNIDKDNAMGCAKSIAVISSVSGGSVGAMYFVSSYENGELTDERRNNAFEVSKESSLDNVAGGFVYADLIRNFPGLDSLFSIDRGYALERSWGANLKRFNDKHGDLISPKSGEIDEKYFSSWRQDVLAGSRPAVIFNSTVVETGERIFFSTTDISQNNPCKEDRKLFEGWKSFHDMFPGKDISIATAARLSASFPVVSPASKMKNSQCSTEALHFVDGGYYEDYGIASLIDWTDEALCSNREKLTAIPRIMIVQIVNDKVFKENKINTLGGGWFAQTLAPVTTFLGARGTIQLSRNEAELEMFQRYWTEKGAIIERVVFEYEGKEYGEEAPLTWHLTDRQKHNLEHVWERAVKPQGKDENKNYKNLNIFLNFIKENKYNPPQ